jgi:hypothetical protein
MEKFLEEDQVTPTNILQLFDNAFMKAALDEDKDIRVTTGPGTVFFVKVLQDKKMLKYMSMFGFKESSTEVEKLAFLNKLNSEVILSRFSMPRNDVLLSEYFLSYEKGIPTYQVISSFRLFERVALGAVGQFDNTDLVE